MVAFASLTLALVLLWVRRPLWIGPAVVAVAAALWSGVIDAAGLLSLAGAAAAAFAAHRAPSTAMRTIAHALLVILTAALFLHLAPGFDNPRIVSGAVLGPGSLPYTKYLNFDKGMAALFLLGLYVPERTTADEGLRHAAGFVWRFVVLLATVLGVALAIGYVRWDPKLPPWWLMWTWSMVFLTALPEEAVFRGVVQTALDARYSTTTAIAVGGLLFGVAHAAGGPVMCSSHRSPASATAGSTRPRDRSAPRSSRTPG